MFDPKEVDRILGIEREPEESNFESKVDSILGVQRKKDGPLARGFNQLSSSIDYSKSMTTGDTAGAARSIAESAKYRKRNPGSKEGNELMEAWESGDGIWGGIRAVAGEMKKDISESKNWRQAAYETGKNVKAMAGGVVEQMPNMVLPMVGMVGGGFAGSFAGPVGTAGGAFAGASTGNAVVEGQHIAIQALQKAGIDLNDEEKVARYLQENAGELFRRAAVKGSIIGAVDTVTAGLGAKLLTAPARAASRRALTSMGVDITDRAAVKIASESPEFKRLLANDAIYQSSKQGIRNAARNAGVAVMDPAGEFAGEYIGSGVALGEWDEKEAMLEALSSIGQSGVMFAGQKGYERIVRPSESLPRVENPEALEVPYYNNDPIEKAFAKTKDTKPSDKDALSLISNPKYTNTVTPEQRPIYDDLVKRGLARNDGGTYSITDGGRKILGQERKPVDVKGMTGKEKQTIKALETKGKPSRLSDLKMDKEQKAAISSLMKKGIIRRNDNGTFELISEDIAPESAERDLMYQFADTAQDVQDQADARTRAYRFEQMPGEIAWREQEQAAREYNQKRNERATNDTLRPNPDQLVRMAQEEAAPTVQEADTGELQAATGAEVASFEDAKEGDVYRISYSDGERYAIRGDNPSGFGDEVYATLDEASRMATDRRKREAANAVTRERWAKAEEEKEKERMAAEDLNGFDADMTPMKRGRSVKALSRSVNYEGKLYSKRDLIRRLVGEGYTVDGGGRFTSPDGQYLEADVLTKTGIDYARYLTENGFGNEADFVTKSAPASEASTSMRKASKNGETSDVPEVNFGNMPPTPEAAPDTGERKEPWQMSYDEYLSTFSKDDREWEGLRGDEHRASVIRAVREGKLSPDTASLMGYQDIANKQRKEIGREVWDRSTPEEKANFLSLAGLNVKKFGFMRWDDIGEIPVDKLTTIISRSVGSSYKQVSDGREKTTESKPPRVAPWRDDKKGEDGRRGSNNTSQDRDGKGGKAKEGTERVTIAGVEFEAVRKNTPRLHWLPKVVETGFVYPTGVFNSDSRPKMWDSMDEMARRIGADRFSREALSTEKPAAAPRAQTVAEPSTKAAPGNVEKLLDFARRVSEASRKRSGNWAADIFTTDGNTEYYMPDISVGTPFELDGVSFRWMRFSGGGKKGTSMAFNNDSLHVTADGKQIARITFPGEHGSDAKIARAALRAMQRHLAERNTTTPPPKAEGAIEAKEQSQRSESAQDDVMEALESTAWYSRLQRIITDKGPKIGPAKQWLTAIESWRKKDPLFAPQYAKNPNTGEREIVGYGPLAEELEWSGLEEYLQSRQGKVSREEVIGFLNDNGVRVEEVVKGGRLSHDRLGWMKRGNVYRPSSEFDLGRIEKKQPNGKYVFYSTAGTQSVHDTLEEAKEALRQSAENAGVDNTKFAQYQLPGGENYREMLITLPSSTRLKELDDALQRGEAKPGDREERLSLERQAYRSSHFEEPNILAHIRFNERTGPDGEKVLFVEEVQSDFGQDYRKQLKNIEKAVESRFKDIVEAMQSAGILQEEC